MNERPQPRRGRSSTRLLTAAPRGAWWAWRTTFALWSTGRAKRSEREHPYSKKHKHLLHSSTSFLVRLLNNDHCSISSLEVSGVVGRHAA